MQARSCDRLVEIDHLKKKCSKFIAVNAANIRKLSKKTKAESHNLHLFFVTSVGRNVIILCAGSRTKTDIILIDE